MSENLFCKEQKYNSQAYIDHWDEIFKKKPKDLGKSIVMEEIEMTLNEFNLIPTYQISLPTGNIIGKRWKRLVDGITSGVDYWVVGEFVRDNEMPDKVFPHYKKVKIIEGGV